MEWQASCFDFVCIQITLNVILTRRVKISCSSRNTSCRSRRLQRRREPLWRCSGYSQCVDHVNDDDNVVDNDDDDNDDGVNEYEEHFGGEVDVLVEVDDKVVGVCQRLLKTSHPLFCYRCHLG